MKKNLLLHFFLILISLLQPHSAGSQNLVPNGSFEFYTSCPTTNSGLPLAVPWQLPPGSGTTPDYFNSCHTGAPECSYVGVPENFIGTAPALDGNAYAAILFIYDFCFNCREYIQVKLTAPLVAGSEYEVYMHIRPGDYNKYMTNNQGIFISDYPISQPSNQPITAVTPQIENLTIISDTSKWTFVGGSYVAVGGEEYITIGNFHNNPQTDVEIVNYQGGVCPLVTGGAMYMIDSVFVGIGNAAPSAGFETPDSTICSVTCIDFTDVSSNNPTSWLWSFPGAIPDVSTDQHPSNICYNTAGSFDVTLIATNAAGSDTIALLNFITVNVLPSVTITQSNDTLYVSAGDSYQWFMDGLEIAGATNSFHVPAIETFYSVMVTDSNGCAASDTLFFSFAPQTSISASDSFVCEKFCLDFTDQSGNNPTQWAWTFEGGIPSASSSENPTNICYNAEGVFDVMLITTNAFGSDTLILTDYITVHPTPPFPVITQNGYILTSSPADFYQWLLNSVEIPGATDQSYEVTQSGFYTVIISDSNGCMNSASVNVIISGTEAVGAEDLFSIYPNPTDGSFVVEYKGLLPGKDWNLEILNAIGVRCLHLMEMKAAQFRREIDLSSWPAGVYLLMLSSGEQRIIQKIEKR